MNKKRLQISLIWLVCLLTAGCTSINEPDLGTQISEEDQSLISFVSDFYNSVKVKDQTKSSESGELIVDKITRQYYKVTADTTAVPISGLSRGSGTDDPIFDISTVEFHIGDNNGFVISNFNEGDNDRTKHRVSFIASRYYPEVKWATLKDLSCIGSHNSWNDRISSYAFYMGNYENRWIDY